MHNSSFGSLSAPTQAYTVLIIGGGLAGALCALSLAKSGHDVTLSAPLLSSQSGTSGHGDDRPLALSHTSINILANILSISTQETLARLQATPIRHIHISEQNHINRILLNAQEQSQDYFGAVVSANALLDHIETSLTHLSSVTVSDRPIPTHQSFDLTIYADGAQSPHREALGLESVVQHYNEIAITGLITVSTPSEHTAFERFTHDGPLAILPFGDQQYAFVLTLKSDAKLDQASVKSAIQSRIGHRLGNINELTIQGQFPLALRYSPRLCTDQHLLLGNSALSMHPIAGQGYNLVVKDIAWITELLAENPLSEALAAYQTTRAPDHRLTREFTHHLVSAFDLPALWPLRGIGMGLVNWIPSLQRLIAQLGGGRMTRQPKLSYIAP